MDLLPYLCVIVYSMNLVHSQIVIPPELRSHYVSSGMEWEDFIEQIIVSLNVDGAAGEIEIEEPEPGQPPEPTLSPSFLNPNSSLMTSLVNGSLGVSLYDLAEIEELPPTPEPAPITPAPPTLAPVTTSPTTRASLTQSPTTGTAAPRATNPALPSLIQVMGFNPAIRNIEAQVPLKHGVLTLHYHSFIETSNTANNASSTGQAPPELFVSNSTASQSNVTTIQNQTSVLQVDEANVTTINPTERPAPPRAIEIQAGRVSQIGTTRAPPAPTAVPGLAPGTERSGGQISGSAPSSDSQAPLYHGILTLHYQSYVPLNTSQQRNESRVGAAATDGFSSGLSSAVSTQSNSNSPGSNSNLSVSGQGAITVTDPLSASSNGSTNTINTQTSQNTGTLGGLSSLISTMIARNRAPTTNRNNRISFNPAVDVVNRRISVSSSGPINNSGDVASNLARTAAPEILTSVVSDSTTPAPVLSQGTSGSINLSSNGQSAVLVQGNTTSSSNTGGIVSNQTIAIQANIITPAPVATNSSAAVPVNTNGQSVPQGTLTSGNTSVPPNSVSSSSGVSQGLVQSNLAAVPSTAVPRVLMDFSNTNGTLIDLAPLPQIISVSNPSTGQTSAVGASRNSSADQSNITVSSASSANIRTSVAGNGTQIPGRQINQEILANFNDITEPLSVNITRSNDTTGNSANSSVRLTQPLTGQVTNASLPGNIQVGNPLETQVTVGQNLTALSDNLPQNGDVTLNLPSQNSTTVVGSSSANGAIVSTGSPQNSTGSQNPSEQNSAQAVNLPSNTVNTNGRLQLLPRNTSTALGLASGSENNAGSSQPAISSSTTPSTENISALSDVLTPNGTGDVELSQEAPRGIVEIPTIPRPATAVPLAGLGAAFREHAFTSEKHLPGWTWAIQSSASSHIPANIVHILLLTSIVFLFH